MSAGRFEIVESPRVRALIAKSKQGDRHKGKAAKPAKAETFITPATLLAAMRRGRA